MMSHTNNKAWTVETMYERIPLQERVKTVERVKEKIREEHRGEVIYLTISGSHLYGVPSKDSDIDYRGAFITGTENLLGLFRKNDVISLKPDIVVFEVAKELSLAVKGNCNVLEHIFSEPIYATSDYLEMRSIMANSLPRNGLYESYRGMAYHNYHKFIESGRNRSVKKYLYVVRGLMAGIYVLETGRVEPSLFKLNSYFGYPVVDVLREAKTSGVLSNEASKLIEKGCVDETITILFDRIDDAYSESSLQDEVDENTVDRLNEWLVNLRKRLIGDVADE